jgi:hypothetical protein
MINLAIHFVPLPKITSESELETLAAVYRFLIQSHENRKATVSGNCGKREVGKNDTSADPSGSEISDSESSRQHAG